MRSSDRSNGQARGVSLPGLAWTLSLALSANGASAQVPVCDRTGQVRDALVAAAGVGDCTQVGARELGEIASLDLAADSIVWLADGDFDGLVRLETLDLSGNAITELPAGVFDPLLSLRALFLHNNQLGALPDGVFRELYFLETLTLSGNYIDALPAGHFDSLSGFSGLDTVASDHLPTRRLQRFLDRQAPASVEEFLAALPGVYMQRVSLVFQSTSPAAEHVSWHYPRVVSWGEDGRLVFAWLADAAAPALLGPSVEFLAQGRRGWHAGVMDFSGGSAQITYPGSCRSCHGDYNKPLWGTYGFWRGTDYAVDDADLAEITADAVGAAMNSTNSRLTPLDFSRTSTELGQNHRHFTDEHGEETVTPAFEAGAVFAWRHAEILRAELSARGGFDAMVEDLCIAPNDEMHTLFAATRMFRAHKDHHLAYTAANPDFLLQTEDGRSHDTAKMAFLYFINGSVDHAVVVLALHELWRRDPTVRELYRNMSNTLVEEKYRYLPAGSATMEDELLQLHRLHFGRGSPASLAARDRMLDHRVPWHVDFWNGHLRIMLPRVCTVLQR